MNAWKLRSVADWYSVAAGLVNHSLRRNRAASVVVDAEDVEYVLLLCDGASSNTCVAATPAARVRDQLSSTARWS
jgi:hypothetical protein